MAPKTFDDVYAEVLFYSSPTGIRFNRSIEIFIAVSSIAFRFQIHGHGQRTLKNISIENQSEFERLLTFERFDVVAAESPAPVALFVVDRGRDPPGVVVG